MKNISEIDSEVLATVRRGTVIPAQPLALDENRRFLPRYQRALCRYYVDAGVGGVAVGVHTTQFAIRDPSVGLFSPVLEKCSGFLDEWCRHRGRKILKIAGICGQTEQAIREVQTALSFGYDAALLSLGAFRDATTGELLDHCCRIASEIPVIGFYLQPDIGGRVLPYEFWRSFMEIENVFAVKIAPFNRYRTIDVVRAAAEVNRDITLYTGNDDNILLDLLTVYRIQTEHGIRERRICGGLLGQWCFWTRRAVELLEKVHELIDLRADISPEILTLAAEITDANAAFFDPAHGFDGCIPGIHEALFRQGLLPGITCLNPEEKLSPGQSKEITRVYNAYPHLNDNEFVAAHLKEWLDD
jgi:hypothetical protein